MSKKKILFVNESLACAGGEKSLLNLLSLLDYDKYEVDLQLIEYGNEWDKLIDPRVNLLPPLDYFEELQISIVSEFRYIFHCNTRKRLFSRLKFAWYLRFGRGKRIPEVACKFWEFHSRNIPAAPKRYDVAIGYAQGLPTLYVADKTNAPVKLCWVNAFYRLQGQFKDFVLSRFYQMRHVVAVSEAAKDVLNENFSEVSNKIRIFQDPLNPELVREMAKEPVSFRPNPSKITIMTLGRLQQYAKGMDILLNTAKVLKGRDVDFEWFVLGKGSYLETMEMYIHDHNLTDCVHLLGAKANPYPYLKQTDIYVQTSREEGFGMAIAEARFLYKPIVSTPFLTIGLQIKDRENGLISSFNPEDIANSIIELHRDINLRTKIINSLMEDKTDYQDQTKQFYMLMEK